METNNRTAAYLASKPVTKLMGRREAITIWNDLKAEGWAPDLNTRDHPMLTKHDEDGIQRFYTFSRVSETKTKVNYMELEVAS